MKTLRKTPFILRRARGLFAALILLSLIIPTTAKAASAYAATQPLIPSTVLGSVPKLVIGPRLSLPAIPNTGVLDPYNIYNNLLISPPAASVEATSNVASTANEGISQLDTGISEGLTLNPSSDVCNDFKRNGSWAATTESKHDISYVHHHHSRTIVPETTVLNPRADINTDWYGGWGPFAVDDGGYYHANNVVFARERVVGPGAHYERENNAAKISSTQPYAAGYGSPLIAVKPGATVTVTVKYMIYDHDAGNKAYDWASLGIKPDATEPPAVYVNGYVRGEWATLTHQIKAGPTGKIMVLLQASSPAAVNSNIYFDDVQIEVNGKYKTSCIRDTTAETTTATPTPTSTKTTKTKTPAKTKAATKTNTTKKTK